MQEQRKSDKNQTDRRGFLGLGLTAAAAAALLPGKTAAAQSPAPTPAPHGRCKLGSLEVSAVGIGVQNMNRKYETTVPYRSEMIAIIRAAFDHGVTFYDAAEEYGPHEVERILGKGVAPFRDKVVSGDANAPEPAVLPKTLKSGKSVRVRVFAI